ncbi:polyprenyl synthetase family protein [Vagococcus hydrophili]|uniref:Farnesyl diphosphate synthase n=1 Tax=Vagococcus hydrophili TaxID=2714947 RepID=A0A6G8ARE1_9ENTE|nr:farnesyl diphosphate synthase [Vagococcus hydrophili]QIL47539.1 polyprenyl synthetase family protein [Vagococcus hydrophili]
MSLNYKEFATEQIPLIDQEMMSFLKGHNQSELLVEAMNYSLAAGGKRFRPLLLLGTVDFFDIPLEKKHYSVAASLEMIHTYSLIHDDLPAMDDDDLRRGKPTNHKVYGEAVAILAGDALLTEAFHLVSETTLDSSLKVELISLLAKASGASGMIAGQMEDMLGENKQITLDELQKMHSKKTGELIKFAVEAGVTLSSDNMEVKKNLVEYAECLGMAFQVKDDLLDVIGDEAVIGKKTGADAAHDKNTYVSFLGLDGAKEAFESYCNQAQKSLNQSKVLLGYPEKETLLDAILEELKVL